ncbi:hypothetical protein ACJX0J_021325, partial [Zea mays]
YSAVTLWFSVTFYLDSKLGWMEFCLKVLMFQTFILLYVVVGLMEVHFAYGCFNNFTAGVMYRTLAISAAGCEMEGMGGAARYLIEFITAGIVMKRCSIRSAAAAS